MKRMEYKYVQAIKAGSIGVLMMMAAYPILSILEYFSEGPQTGNIPGTDVILDFYPLIFFIVITLIVSALISLVVGALSVRIAIRPPSTIADACIVSAFAGISMTVVFTFISLAIVLIVIIINVTIWRELQYMSFGYFIIRICAFFGIGIECLPLTLVLSSIFSAIGGLVYYSLAKSKQVALP